MISDEYSISDVGAFFGFKICIGATYFHVVLSPITNSVTRFELASLLRVHYESEKKTNL